MASPRCPFCGQSASRHAATCPECGAQYHPECRGAVGRCVAPACSDETHPAPGAASRSGPTPPPRPSAAGPGWGWFVATLAIGLLSGAGGSRAWRERPRLVAPLSTVPGGSENSAPVSTEVAQARPALEDARLTVALVKGPGDDDSRLALLDGHRARYPGRFAYEIENERRHLLQKSNPKRALEVVDGILEHEPEHGYTLDCVERDLQAPRSRSRIDSLLALGRSNPDLVHLKAACTLRAAGLLKGAADADTARKLLAEVAAAPEPTLAPYRALAEQRLGKGIR